MIADLQPYPKYKESTLPWLPQIPAHWNVARNGHLFAQRNQTGFSELPILEVSLKTGVRIRNFDESARKQVMRNRGGYKRAAQGDIAYNMMRMWQGASGRVPVDGLVSPAYVIARPFDDTDARFFAYLFRVEAYLRQINSASRGIVPDRNRLYWVDFKQLPSVVPPTTEQAAIVRFLDHATGRIERAIRAKKKLLALLNEQKQAIIHSAITRGLDPMVPLRSSGIPWLGDIPKSWEVRRLKTLSAFVTSGSRGWARYYSDDGPIFLRIGNISATSVDLKLHRITHVSPPADAEGERTRVVEHDILLSITAQIGAVGVVPGGLGEAYVNQHTALIRLNPGSCEPRWIAFCLLSDFGKSQCQLLTNGGTKIGLTLDDVRTLRVLLPPITEQQRIVAQIESKTLGLNSTTRRTDREIELLREYRTRLVADVVTGKLDVREAAADIQSQDLEEPLASIATEDLADESELEPSRSDDEP